MERRERQLVRVLFGSLGAVAEGRRRTRLGDADRFQQAITCIADLKNRSVECFLVYFGRFIESADLSHELPGGCAHFVWGCGLSGLP